MTYVAMIFGQEVELSIQWSNLNLLNEHRTSSQELVGELIGQCCELFIVMRWMEIYSGSQLASSHVGKCSQMPLMQRVLDA